MAHAPPTAPAPDHLIQPPQQSQQPPPSTSYNMTFPPFPHLQHATPLIPFAEFLPKGIQIKGEEDQDSVEVDGDGIPTVMLGVTHDIDKPKSKKKKSKSSASNAGGSNGTRKPWFEQWADSEIMMRAERLNPAQCTPFQILDQADIDFQHGRTFPLSVRAIYNEFRVFIGIIERIEKRPAFQRYPKEKRDASSSTPDATQQPPSASAGDDPEESFSDDVDDDEIGVPVSEIRNDTVTSSLSIPELPPAAIGDANNDQREEEYTGTLEPLQERSQLAANARCEQFLANPALAIKCFLSHEFRNRGLYWREFDLYAGPIIVLAFLEFIIRHELLPMEEYGKALKEAAEVARGAKEELPRTKKASAVLRDGWGTVCVDIWGTREEAQWGIDGLSWSSKTDDEGYITELNDAPVATLIDESDNLILLPPSPPANPGTSSDSNPGTSTTAVPNKPSNDSLKTTTTVVDASAPGSNTESWGWDSSAASTHVPTEGDSTSMPPVAAALKTADDATHGWGTHEDEENESPTWDTLSPTPSMFTYVGCASFPLTHAPVRAERGVREILAIHPPMDLFASTHANPISLLHSKLATVVLAPWRNANSERSYKECGDIPPPVMLRMCSSEREERRTPNDDQAEEEFPAQFFLTGEVGRTHDAFKDVITVLVDPEVVDNLTVGIGVGGTFVQVARRLDAPIFPAIKDGNTTRAAHYGDNGKKASNKSAALPSYKPNDGRSWWYIDNVSQVIPSYWTNIDDLPAVDGLATA